MKTSEDALVERAKQDRQAFSELYESYAPRIYKYIYHRTNNAEEAEELTATVFLRALSHLDSYEFRGQPFGTWLFTIAHNLLVNWYRDRQRRAPTALQLEIDSQDVTAILTTAEDLAAVKQVISALPEDRQLLIFLKFTEGLSNAETGRIMGRSEGAIKSLLHRTIQSLRGEIESERKDDEVMEERNG